jgi:hypothetical protein
MNADRIVPLGPTRRPVDKKVTSESSYWSDAPDPTQPKNLSIKT